MSVALRPDDLVLVTGGSGFLGSAVVRALIARGSRDSFEIFILPVSQNPYSGASLFYFRDIWAYKVRVVG